MGSGTSRRVESQRPDQASDITTDATLVVEGKEIPVNKGLLKVCSPALSKKFTAGTNNLELNDEKYDQMFLLVQQLIPEHIVSTPVEDDHLEPLLTLAQKYEVKHVTAKCEMYIGEELKKISPKPESDKAAHDVLLYLHMCEKFKLKPELSSQLVELASEFPCQMINDSQHFSSVSEKARAKIFYKRCKLLGDS